MKQPERIDFETDYEYDLQMDIYYEYLINEEWFRSRARNALKTYLISILGIIAGTVAGYFIADFLI